MSLTAFSHDLDQLLEDVYQDEQNAECQLLTAIVVRSEDGLPGNGFFDVVKRRGMTLTRKHKFRDEHC